MKEIKCFKILTSTPKEKRLLKKPTHKWKFSIIIDLKEIDIDMRNWIDLAQDRNYLRALVNADSIVCGISEYINVPS